MESFNRGITSAPSGPKLLGGPSSKILYPTAATPRANFCGCVSNTFGGRLKCGTLSSAIWTSTAAWKTSPRKTPSTSTTPTHPGHPRLMRILLDECGYGWDQAWDVSEKHLCLHQPRCWPRRWSGGTATCSSPSCPASTRSSLRSTAGCAPGSTSNTTWTPRRGPDGHLGRP